MRREEPAQGLGALRRPLRDHLQPHLRGQHRRRAEVAGDLPGRVQGRRPRPAVPRGVHLERHGAHQPGGRAAGGGHEGLREGLRRACPAATLPEDQKQTWLGRLHHGKARTLARMGKHAEAWAEVGDGREDDRRGRRSRPAVLARVPLRGRLREAGGGGGRGRAGAPAAGGPEGPVPRPAAGPRLREGRPEGRGQEGLPEGASTRSGRASSGRWPSPRPRRRFRRCRWRGCWVAVLLSQGGNSLVTAMGESSPPESPPSLAAAARRRAHWLACPSAWCACWMAHSRTDSPGLNIASSSGPRPGGADFSIRSTIFGANIW